MFEQGEPMWAWVAIGASAAPIVGGVAVTTDMDPVVAVVRDGVVVCSGTLVHPEWVLTAGHCIDEAPTDVWWGTDVRGGAVSLEIGVEAMLVHPDRDGRDYDVGLLHLDRASTGEVAALGDAPPAVGDVVAAFGFGATTDGADDGGVKRAVDLDVIDVQPVVVTTYRGGANLCSGDSGGPLVRPGTTPMEVVAVATFVDPTCLGGAGGGSRADAIAGFVADHVPDLVDVWIPPDVDVDDRDHVDAEDGATTRRGSGCRTASGSAGWSFVLMAAIRVRRGRPSVTRGKSSASR